MPLNIPVPSHAHSEIRNTLGGLSYTIEYKFNSRDKGWRFDVYDSSGNSVKLGCKVVENTAFFTRFRLPGFSTGDIFCTKIDQTEDNINFNNLGFNKAYVLTYLTNAEIAELLEG
jgi:hypothetical protein